MLISLELTRDTHKTHNGFNWKEILNVGVILTRIVTNKTYIHQYNRKQKQNQKKVNTLWICEGEKKVV